MTAQHNLPDNKFWSVLICLLAAFAACCIIASALAGCAATSQPVEIKESLVQLRRIEAKPRSTGYTAFLYWYNFTDKQTYLQVLPCADTVKYKTGMYRVAYLQR